MGPMIIDSGDDGSSADRSSSRARGDRLNDHEKAEIIRLHGLGFARNAIAAEVDVAAGSVSNVIADAGLSFDRKATEAATRARQRDMRARRIDLEADLLDDLEIGRYHLRQAKGGQEFAWAARGIESLAASHEKLARLDPPDPTDLGETGSMLDGLLRKFGLVRDEE